MNSAELKRVIRKREQPEETDAEGSWAISYGDMITLLLTFFILFFNVNTKKVEQKTQLQKAILAEFGMEKDQAKKDDAMDPAKMALGTDKKGELEANLIKEWGGVLHREGDKIVVEFPNINFFDFSKIDVNKNGIPALEHFAQKYLRFAGGNSLSVKAFTDSVKVKGEHRFRDNLELSALRAVAAMRVLQHAGIPLDKMRIAGNGEGTVHRQPGSETNLNPRGDALARKVILVIEPLTQEKL